MKSSSKGPKLCVRAAPYVLGAALAAGCGGATPAKAPRPRLADSPIRVTEIHFDPSPGQGKAAFVEVTDVSASPVDLSGWRVTGAGPLVLPKGTALAAGQAIVVCKDAEAFRKAFGAAVAPVAVFTGKLKNAGETIRVEDPAGAIADEARYAASDPEVKAASNTGLSIHRADLGGEGSWKAAAPTPGAYEAPVAAAAPAQ